MKFENEEEEKLFLKLVIARDFYKSCLDRIMATEDKEKKRKILKGYGIFLDKSVEGEKLNAKIDLKKKVFITRRQMEGNLPILWDLMMEKINFSKILSHLCNILGVSGDKDFVDINKKYLFEAEIDFFEKGISYNKKKEIYRRLTGENYEEKND